MPSVSIIVPVYNKENYLEACLSSLCSQTCSDIEILCVNNNSSDDSLNILTDAAKKDPRIKVLSESQQGVSFARNTGLDNATGDFVGFIDADDFIDATYYEKLIAAAQTYDAEVAFCGYKQYYPSENRYDREVLPTYGLVVTPSELGKELFFTTTPSVCTKLFKRSLIEATHCRFDTSLLMAEDLLFSYGLIAQAKRIAAVPEALYHYRQETHSQTDADNKALFGTHLFDAMDRLSDYLDRIGAEESIKDGLPSCCFAQMGGILTITGTYEAYKAIFDRFKTDWAPRMAALPEDKIVEHLKPYWKVADNASCVEDYLFSVYHDVSNRQEYEERLLHGVEKERDKARNERAELESSITFKVGDTLMRIPRKIRAIVQP